MINKEKIKLKKLLIPILVVILSLSTLCIFLQKDLYQNLNKDISYFNNIYAENIKQKPYYSFRVISIDSETTEGAEMSVYFKKDDGSIKIVETSYGGETFRQQYNYYFNDLDNFLLEEIYQQWNAPFYVEEGERKKIKYEISRYYFNKLKMIYWIDERGQEVNLRSEKFKQKEKEILLQLDMFLKYIN